MIAARDVRRLRAEDAERVGEVMAVFAAAFEDRKTYLSAAPSPDYWRGLLATERLFVFAAFDAGHIVGGLTAYELPKPEQARCEWYVYDLAVDAAHRRRGYATRLIHEACALARRRGASAVFVQADDDDPAAIALYRSLGAEERVRHFDLAMPV